jgi:glycosyltransferase involved in cell wall biosynthesis
VKIFVSIIIPIYNMQNYLRQCLDSLVKQSFPDSVEIILLDDGSTDDSGIICDKMMHKDTHFRVIHQKNQGIAATRNRGIREARGKYIAWVDPDDYITDDWWRTIFPILEQNPELVLFDFKILHNKRISCTHFDQSSRIIEREEIFRELADGIRFQSHLWSKIFLRTLFDHEKTFDENLSYAEDYQAMHHILFSVQRCEYIHKCIYVYRQRNGSLIHDREKDLTNTWLSVKLSKERYQFYTEKNIKVSRFGILYWEIIFCKAYQSQKKLANEWTKRYNSCVTDLIEHQKMLWKTKKLSLVMRIRLFLLTHHMGNVLGLEPIVKKIVRWRKLEN